MAFCSYSLTGMVQDLSGIIRTEDLWEADWLLYVIILPLILYAIVISVEKFPTTWLSRIVYINRFALNAYRNRSHGSQIGNTLLPVIAVISLSTLGYFLEVSYDLYFFSLKGIALWFFNLALFAVALGLRLLLISLIASLTGTRDAFDEYAYNIMQFYKFSGIPLLFINFFIPYFEGIPDLILFIISLMFIASLLIMRPLRLASVFIRRGFSLLYFILYLCALEFIPVLVFAKYLAGAV